MSDWHEQVMRASDSLVDRVARQVAARARQLAPVDTGELRDSIHVEHRGEGAADVVVGTDYWIYNEYGHRQFAWGHDTGHGSPAQPFMRPALYSARGSAR